MKQVSFQYKLLESDKGILKKLKPVKLQGLKNQFSERHSISYDDGLWPHDGTEGWEVEDLITTKDAFFDLSTEERLMFIRKNAELISCWKITDCGDTHMTEWFIQFGLTVFVLVKSEEILIVDTPTHVDYFVWDMPSENNPLLNFLVK